jgi:hypothetical protein
VLMALQPGLFTAAGLVSSGTMAMSSMPAPAASHVAYRAVAGPYALMLTIGPAETMLAPAEARRTHARTGEVMLDRAMASAMPMGGMQRHLELRVVDRAMGMAVTDARVTIRVLGPGAPQSMLRLAHVYDTKEGMKDLHYGANLNLDQGAYTVRVGVNNHVATLHVRVP